MKIVIGIVMVMFMSSLFAKDYKVDDLAIYETDELDIIKLNVFVGRLVSSSHEYLIEFVGAAHKYDGQVFHYQKTSPSKTSKKVNYHLSSTRKTPLRDKNRSTLIKGSIVPYLETYIDRKTVRLFRSRKMDTLSMSEREEIKEGLTSKYLFLGNGDGSMTLSDSLLRVKKQASMAAQSCNKIGSFNVTVDDSSPVTAKLHLQRSIQYFQAMQSLCEEDIDYQEEMRKIDGLVFSFSDKIKPFSLALKNGVLSVEIAKHQENTVLFVKKWLEENL